MADRTPVSPGVIHTPHHHPLPTHIHNGEKSSIFHTPVYRILAIRITPFSKDNKGVLFEETESPKNKNLWTLTLEDHPIPLPITLQ